MENCDIIIAVRDKTTGEALRKALLTYRFEFSSITLCETPGAMCQAMGVHSSDRIIFSEYAFLPDICVASTLAEVSPQEKLILIDQRHCFEQLLAALRRGIFDCLCLPVDDRELYDCVDRALGRLRWQRIEARMGSNTASRQMLWRMVHRIPVSTMRIPQLNKVYGTRFSEGLFRALFVEMISPGDPNRVFRNEDMQDFAMRLCNQILQTECFDILYNQHTNGVSVLINYAAPKQEKITHLIDQLFFHLHREFDEAYHVSVMMSVSRTYSEVSKLQEIKHEVLDARWYRRTTGSDGIIQADAMEERSELTLQQQREFQNLWDLTVHYYEMLDIDRAISCVKQFLSAFQDVLSIRQFRLYSRRLVTLLFEIYESELSTYGDKDSLLQEYIHRETSASTDAQFKHAVTANVTDLLQKIEQVVQCQYTQPVRECMSYIASHYSENIRLADLADVIGLSPQYLSNLFHNETGQTISEYIALQKLNAAKNMLKHSEKRINEIAYALGFEDTHYFSKFFKKHLQVTPSKYRHIEGAKDTTTM